MRGLFIFHRDLRIIDNIGLLELNNRCKEIIPVFIFTPLQVSNQNSFKSDNAIQFMIESLYDLENFIKSKNGKLIICYGKSDIELNKLIKELKIDIVGSNFDITPFAIERENDYRRVCKKNNIEFISYNDYYLYEPGSIKVSSTGKAYTKYTPFYNKTKDIKILKPENYKKIKFFNENFKSNYSLDTAFKELIVYNENLLVEGRRSTALKILSNINDFKNYNKDRDFFNYNTTQLSAYIKFGNVSVREVAEKFIKNEALFKQLVWREFYAQILFDYPEVLKGPLKEKYDKINWKWNKNYFKLWCSGETGFPIVDASMRELNSTGYMHNRGRLIVACFLIKTLLINWQKGEEYFATKLTDYDPASNNGNWQWVASTGADSQPYFRIFNPWTQQKEYDPDCKFIKYWIPELENVPIKDIHKWNEKCKHYIEEEDIDYYEPIVDYKERREDALEMYKKAI